MDLLLSLLQSPANLTLEHGHHRRTAFSLSDLDLSKLDISALVDAIGPDAICRDLPSLVDCNSFLAPMVVTGMINALSGSGVHIRGFWIGGQTDADWPVNCLYLAAFLRPFSLSFSTSPCLNDIHAVTGIIVSQGGLVLLSSSRRPPLTTPQLSSS